MSAHASLQRKPELPARNAVQERAGGTMQAVSGMPRYLAPVQLKCDRCDKQAEPDKYAKPKPLIGESEAERDRVVQRDGDSGGVAPLGAAGMHGLASQGVAQASEPMPGLERIQSSFGRHDVSDVQAQVGGPAQQAAEGMGARAYTVGSRVGFKSEPDLHLAAHEAAHVVQQRRGVRLKDGVGRQGDCYEQRADAVADRVVAHQSAEDLLDQNDGAEPQQALQHKCSCGGRGCSNCGAAAANGDDCEAVQMELEVNATRQFESMIETSEEVSSSSDGDGGGGGDSGADGDGSGSGDVRADASTEEGDGEADGSADGGSAPGASGGGGSAGGGGSGLSGGGPNASSGASPTAPAPDAGSGGASPSATPAPTAAPPSASGGKAGGGAGGGGGTATSTTGRGDCSGATPQPFHRPREEPNPAPDTPPPNPAATQVQEETSAGDEEDLAEPDNCAQATGGAVDLAAPSGASPGPASASAPDAGAGDAAAVPGDDGGKATPDAAAGGGGKAGAGGGGGGGGADAAPMISVGSPLDDVIASAEGQRGAAVAAYTESRSVLASARSGTGALREGTGFAAQAGESAQATTQRRTASARANSFFSGVADRLDAAISMASEQIPNQLGVAAESAKSQIAATMISEQRTISARIEQARGQARDDAAMARGAVRRQAASFIGSARAQTTAAISTLRTAHRNATNQVDALETTTLDQVNQVYATGRTDLEGLGTTIGDECTTKGQGFAATYRSFANPEDNGRWDGDLSERRAAAQATAAESVAKGYHDRLVEAARKRAREATRDGRKSDRCSVIATARQTRSTLDQQLDSLIQALEAARDATIAQAGRSRDQLIGSIQQSLGATLRQLDHQEHEQRQTINDSGYMQQVLQEQIAHASAAALQQAVASAVSSTQSSMASVQAQCATSVPPDLALLDQALLQVEQRVSTALNGLTSSAEGGAAGAERRLASTAQQGLSTLASVTQGNDEQAQVVSSGFTAGMSKIAGTDNFSSQRKSFTQQITQSIAAGSAALAQAVTGMSKGCEATLSAAATALTKAHTDLETNLRQQRAGLECEMTSKADEAASHEAPAWKRWVAVLLVIIVIIIVIAVIIATGGGALAGLGPLAAIAAGAAIGAAVGAVTAGLLAVAGNLWSNRDWTEGVGTAILIGAVTGALGGGIGAAAGAGVGALFSGARAGVQVAAQLGAALVVAGGMDVATQYVTHGFSFDHFSWTQLGGTMIVTVLTFGIGHRVGVRAVARAAAVPAAAAPPSVAPPEPTIGFGRTPAARPPGAPPTPEPTIGFGRAPAPRPAGAAPTPEPTLGFGRTPAPRPAGAPPTAEPTIGFGRTPAPRPAGAPPTPEPTIGFGRNPAPRPAGAPPTPEPTIGFGRNPAPRPPGTPPTPEPTIGFGRTPGPRPAGPAGSSSGPTAMAPEPVISGPRPSSRGSTPSAINEGNAPRAMANPNEPSLGNVTEPVTTAPREQISRTTAPSEELPAPIARPNEEVRPLGTPGEELPARPAASPAEEPAPSVKPTTEERPATTTPEETAPPTTPKEEAPPTSRPNEEEPLTAKPNEEPAPPAPEEAPATQKPWEEGRNPERYARYKNNLQRRSPGRKPLDPEDWWNAHGSEPPRNPGGGEGRPDHRAKVEDLRALAQSEYPPPRYRLTSNQKVAGLSEKPDVAVIDTETGKVVKVYEAARFNKSGGLVRPDERGKIPHYEDAGIPYEFHPVGSNQPPGGILKPAPVTPVETPVAPSSE